MTRKKHFEGSLFDFLSDLKDNNNREWFKANKERYQTDVQLPLLRFISDVSEPLSEISPHFIADPRPVGGSMFRIYRDVRFARDKRPYKTLAAAQFRHEQGRDVHAPGSYLHLEPGACFAGAGLWHPAAATLQLVRARLVDDEKGWIKVRKHLENAGLELGGDSLKRAPRGIDPEHPLIDDLKRKDFVCSRSFKDSEVTKAGFLDRFMETCRDVSPLMRYLTEALDLRF